jgi:hypothetical protein
LFVREDLFRLALPSPAGPRQYTKVKYRQIAAGVQTDMCYTVYLPVPFAVTMEYGPILGIESIIIICVDINYSTRTMVFHPA